MRIFKLDEKKGALQDLESNPFSLEKEIQNLTEQNLENVFGLIFIKSEMKIQNFRFDTLAYNPETNSFVIIEYKNNQNFSVIDQGYAYLATMLNRKADFILEYSKKVGRVIEESEIDWSQSRVIFVAPSYTTFQKQSVEFRDLPMELWEIKRFEKDLIVFLPLEQKQTNATIKTIKKDEKIQQVSQEIVPYTEELLLDKKGEKVKELYEIVKEKILNLGEITLKPTKHYVAFVGKRRHIVDIEFQKERMKIWINLKFSEIKGDLQFVRDVTNIGHYGNGDCEIIISDYESLEYAFDFIKQSYRINI